MKKLFIGAAALGIVLAGCDAPTGATGGGSIEEQIANATCVSPVPPRDNWLRAEHPSVEEVREQYAEVGANPDESGVFKAYKAWKDSGENHEAAAAVFGDDYAKHAACWA